MNYYEICKITGVLRYLPAKSREYGDTYFMEEYQNQYHKTYYDDEPNLRSLAKRRLAVLKSLEPEGFTGKTLLEVGSAAGFFLDEARFAGYRVEGLELSSQEVAYSIDKLGLDVKKKSVLDIGVKEWANRFDAIACFFVIEHISDIEGIWERMEAWLKPGAYLFLAVPSFFGPSFQTNPSFWLQTHPEDHFYDYDVNSLKKLLSILGFRMKYARPMSYHQKRDLGLLGKLPTWAFKRFSNLMCYGDTIEVVFQKK
ncbi:2-polyprenyl-3-methyl-5-hydroxy-6-metoxy-1,4-benzoquinol methylase [Leptospira ryugenii]|uniref:2-polyprenyl-3-methyl-5-hydroxy-6-metoxy-1,4-benzoquinol methylase n=1 Tax=Leptospira ryugenii TaxID=1917863 RepID=A0A2P2DYC0_9LEPT|nr:2-polyprenyl-3-methyl-5-hydroxy-6-metoxy-1,4-benzoquinol methylase [Leptospira ryugenii]